MIFYHGTDIDSALHILNRGLDASELSKRQGSRPTQLGSGWYTAIEPEVAWFFAALAAGNRGHGYTVIELELADDAFEQMLASGLAILDEIHNVPFVAQQVCFSTAAFALLNQQGIFRPCRSKEASDG